MSWIYLSVATLTSILVWPVMRWGTRGDNDALVLGFWMSFASAIGTTLEIVLYGNLVMNSEIWIAGGCLAVAYAIGFAGLICYCQQIGPIGPTATVNNMAKIFSVLYVVLWLEPHIPNWFVITGIAGGCVAVILLSLSTEDGSDQKSPPAHSRRITKKWMVLVMIAGVLSGVSLTAQTHVGVRFPGADNSFTFMSVGFIGSSLLLLPFAIKRGAFRLRIEMASGFAIGALTLIGVFCTLQAFALITPEVVFPVIVTLPLVITMFLGRFLYKEHLSNRAIAGCAIAIVSLFLIGVGTGA